MSAKRIDAGLDYLRVTSEDARDHNNMEEFYNKIARGDVALGYKEHSAGAFGFFGHATRHALLAKRADRKMLQVSGSRAKDGLYMLSATSQATRLDVQTTVRLSEQSVSSYIKTLHAILLEGKNREGRQATIRAIQTNGEYQTIYIGSRASDWYMRIYDKYAESGKEEYRDCVRFEIELKGRVAKGIWKYMHQNGKGVVYLLKVLEARFAEFGIEIPDKEGWEKEQFRPAPEQKCIEKTLRWLETSVAPSVGRVSSEMGWLQPLIALFSDILYQDEMNTLAQNMAFIWGS